MFYVRKRNIFAVTKNVIVGCFLMVVIVNDMVYNNEHERDELVLSDITISVYKKSITKNKK